MKFEYDSDKDRGECVAYIQKGYLGWECLTIKDINGKVFSIFNDLSTDLDDNWDSNDERTIRRFYPGDKITITF